MLWSCCQSLFFYSEHEISLDERGEEILIFTKFCGSLILREIIIAIVRKKTQKKTARIAQISSVRHGSCNHQLLFFLKEYNRLQLR